MISLQQTFKYQGDVKRSSLSIISIAASFPVFDYAQVQPGRIEVVRTTSSTDRREIECELAGSLYRILAPSSDLTGQTPEQVKNFLIFTRDAVASKNIGNLSFTVPVQFAVGTSAIGNSAFEVMYFIKNLRNLYDGIEFLKSSHTEPASSSAVAFLEGNIILINKEAYGKLLPKFKSISGTQSNWSLLAIAQRYVEESDLDPFSPIKAKDKLQIFKQILNSENIEPRAEVTQFLESVLKDLFDFPIEVPAITNLNVAGTFQIKAPEKTHLAQEDFQSYDLSLEYLQLSTENMPVPQVVHYDWSKHLDPITKNKLPFHFDPSEQAIVDPNIWTVR